MPPHRQFFSCPHLNIPSHLNVKNHPDVKIFIASILIFINFAPLIVSKDKTKKTIDMKKTLLSALKHGSGILLTIFALLCSCQVWAGTETTVYYAVPTTTVGTYTVKLNVDKGKSSESWSQYNMTKCMTYSGNDLYFYTFTDKENGLKKLQFQLYDGSQWKSQEEPISGTWTAVSEYNGKVWVHGSGSWRTSLNSSAVETSSTPTSIGSNTATCTGTYTVDTEDCIHAGGIEYKTAGGSYTLQSGTVSSGSISADITGLSAVTTYYYKAYVVLKGNVSKVYSDDEQSFITLCQDDIEVTGPASGSMTICAGAGDALSVTASGASDYTYQWYYNSTASTEGATSIDGANSASYSPTISGTKYYYCVVGADTYCDKTSSFSGAITYDSSKTSPVITASETNVTNYTPVTLTATGASISTWAITSGSGVNQYMYKETGTSAIFKGNVGSGSAVTYTITGTTANDCSSAVNVTVNSDSDICQ